MVMVESDRRYRRLLYAVCLSSGAILSGWLASSIHILWPSIVIYVLAAIAAVGGFVVMFRGN
jgi:hypothetical protein